MGESLTYSKKQTLIFWYLRKFIIIWAYLFDYIRNREYFLIWVLIKSIFCKKTNAKDLIVNTHFGKFFVRKNTMDFKMASRAYEGKVYKAFLRLLNKAEVVIEIGSNSGVYAITAAKNKVPTLSFEPIEENYQALLKNLEINDINDKVDAFQFGLGNKNETIEFNFNSYNTGAASKFDIRYKTTKREVEIKKFDDLHLDVLKNKKSVLIILDVEGMEPLVIEGMQNFLKSTPEVNLIIESKHVGNRVIKKSLSQIADFKIKNIDAFNIIATKLN